MVGLSEGCLKDVQKNPVTKRSKIVNSPVQTIKVILALKKI